MQVAGTNSMRSVHLYDENKSTVLNNTRGIVHSMTTIHPIRINTNTTFIHEYIRVLHARILYIVYCILYINIIGLS